ncbi:MAG: phage portal protein [Anaerotignaceae bacterium]
MNLSAFLNPIKEENVKLVVSKRFVDEDGKPAEWEIRAMTDEENREIRKSCKRKIPVKGAYGQYSVEFDDDKYLALVTARCVVYPDLNSAELQNAYGVMGAEGLLRKMLKPGEFTMLSNAVSTINGYDEVLGDLVEEAKN